MPAAPNLSDGYDGKLKAPRLSGTPDSYGENVFANLQSRQTMLALHHLIIFSDRPGTLAGLFVE
jgi:hypothetical protein